MNTDRLFSQTKHLPAYQIADSVNQKLAESSNLVITAPLVPANQPCCHLPFSTDAKARFSCWNRADWLPVKLLNEWQAFWASLSVRRLAIAYASKTRHLLILASKSSPKESSLVCWWMTPHWMASASSSLTNFMNEASIPTLRLHWPDRLRRLSDQI